jgi:transcriptional regulator of acetoin/glycerol metabolism
VTGHQPARFDGALRHVLARVADSADGASPVSNVVRDSWGRAAQAGLKPDRIHAPYDPDIDHDSRLRWAAAPVLTAVSCDLPDLPVALLLTDQRSHVIGRWTRTAHHALLMDAVGAAPGFVCDEALIGTNSIGLAAYSGAPSVVRGFEHYADALTHVSCASSPVVDPTTGQLAGVVNITSADPTYSPVVLALVGRIVYETEQRLLAERGLYSSALHDAFVRARRHVKGPLVALDATSMFLNTSAGTAVASADREQLWDWAQHSMGSRRGTGDPLVIHSGARPIRCEQVYDGPTPRRRPHLAFAAERAIAVRAPRLRFRAHPLRAQHRRTRRRGTDQPRDRRRALHLAAHGRLPPASDLPEAQSSVTGRPRQAHHPPTNHRAGSSLRLRRLT